MFFLNSALRNWRSRWYDQSCPAPESSCRSRIARRTRRTSRVAQVWSTWSSVHTQLEQDRQRQSRKRRQRSCSPARNELLEWHWRFQEKSWPSWKAFEESLRNESSWGRSCVGKVAAGPRKQRWSIQVRSKGSRTHGRCRSSMATR